MKQTFIYYPPVHLLLFLQSHMVEILVFIPIGNSWCRQQTYVGHSISHKARPWDKAEKKGKRQETERRMKKIWQLHEIKKTKLPAHYETLCRQHIYGAAHQMPIAYHIRYCYEHEALSQAPSKACIPIHAVNRNQIKWSQNILVWKSSLPAKIYS